MKKFLCRRANKLTPGIQDLEDLGELDILKDGQSILPLLWEPDCLWNQPTEVGAENPELAAIKFWITTSVCHRSHQPNPGSQLTHHRCEILWDDSDCFLEVQEIDSSQGTTLVRVYRIDFNLDHGLHAILLSKILVNDGDFIVTRLETLDDDT